VAEEGGKQNSPEACFPGDGDASPEFHAAHLSSFSPPVDRSMKIALVDLRDPRDPRNWSGTPFHIFENMSLYGQLQVIGRLNRSLRQIYLGHKIYLSLNGKRFDEERTRFALRLYARRIKQALDSSDVQAVLSVSSPAVADLECSVPIIFWTDACFAAMRGYYDDFSSFCARSVRDGERQEREALRRCHLAIYSSEWAANRARDHYPETSEKVRVVPFGANLDPCYDEPTVAGLIAGRAMNECNLLFVGADWRRKGGPTVLEAARLMNTMGLRTALTIIGCAPFGSVVPPPYVKVAGFLDPRHADDRKRLATLFSESHFVVLPSRAEAYGIVLCEAAAFGLPAIASRTGGIPSIVRDSLTGMLIPENATPTDYAAVLSDLFRDKARYRKMSMAAYREYKMRLNWPVACESVMHLLDGSMKLANQSQSAIRLR
jgi:glycosyltransferase involved in cell wall biosynthesis